MKVILITPFSPDIGGGSVNLNSWIPALSEQAIDITWLYLSERKVTWFDLQERPIDNKYIWIGRPLMGGNLWKDLVRSLFLWSGIKTGKLKKILDIILDIEADIYWIVAHNEGVLIASELARRSKVPIHLTLQDIPDALFVRSRRYRWLSALAQRRLLKVMKSARSIDVTSEEMGYYYQKIWGIKTTVIHPYVPCLPTLKPIRLEQDRLTIGQIGSIYSVTEFYLFCQALQDYTKSCGLDSKVIMIGTRDEFVRAHLKKFSKMILSIPKLSEVKAIKQLSQCHFLYAMYPFNCSSAIFRQTSFPSKLGAYLQVQRPIFAHTPDDSTLAKFIKKYRLGSTCNSLAISHIVKVIEKILHYELDTASFKQARMEMFGEENIKRLLHCFIKGEVLSG